MLDTKVAELLNVQVNREFYSAYLYLDFSNYYTEQGLDGFANWYRIQAQEERDHAMLFMQYMQNNGCKVTLEAIDKPDKEFASAADPLHAGYEHEQYVTSLIHNILRCGRSGQGFPHHAVSGLVCEGAGRGGKQRGDAGKEIRTVRG